MGSYEIYRKFESSSLKVERQTVHLSDDSGRIAMLEKRTLGTDPSPASLVRYIYSNHLQSASLELDENADIISYEEYHPYGTTSYQANNASINAVAKRYRYTGKERDEESGLYYNGARYYIPWLCRWCAVDPMESKYAGMSPYNYAFNNPVIFNDPSGADPDKDEVIYYSEPDDEIVITGERFPCDWPIVYSQSEENTPGFALNDDNLLIPGGYTVAKEKGSIYVLAMRSPEGVVYKWNDEARWYVTDDGKSFDNPWYHDIANFMQSSTRNSIGTYANDILVHGSPFYTIGESYNTYKKQGGEWGVFGFVGTGLKQSAINTFEDFQYGGHRRMNAIIGIWQFSSNMAKSYSLSISTASKSFYSVQSVDDINRLKSGGAPWPTLPNRAALGEGLYAWDNLTSAKNYLSTLEKFGGSNLKIVEFSIKYKNLGKFNKLEVDKLANPSGWLNKNSKLWNNDIAPSHNFNYIIRGTNFGNEHFFHKSIFGKFKFKR